MNPRTKADALLILITLIWGSTFVIVKAALDDASPLAFIAARFVLAGLLLYVLLARGKVARRSLVPGLVLGAISLGALSEHPGRGFRSGDRYLVRFLD